jgi:RNA polymerase sigma-70 factor (ECF subfamily)
MPPVADGPGDGEPGDPSAVPLRSRDAGTLYEDLAPAVLGYLRSLSVREPEEVLGEVFVQVVRDLPKFRGDDVALRRWVFTIAHHRAMDDHRRRRRRPVDPRPDAADAVDTESSPDDDPLVDPDLVRALAQLTPEQREVVALRFVADLSIEEVARLLRKRPGAVKSLQHRALDRLAELLSG